MPEQSPNDVLRDHQRDWEHLGKVDPLWAILSLPDKRYGGWNIEEFFATGEAEIGELMQRARTLGHPREVGAALDFGCGVGRLTRALAGRFERAVGVDISEPMVVRARELNADRTQCEFIVNTSERLPSLADASFDLVYSNIVLQHVPGRALIEGYIAEFVRILRPGGLLAFQLPSKLSLRARLNPRRRLYNGLKVLGAGERFLYDRLKLSPINMTAIPEQDVRRLLESCGARLLTVDCNQAAGPSTESRMYFATRK